MLQAWILLAEQTGEGGPPPFAMFAWFAVLAVLFVMIVLRPAQKEEQKRKTLVASLKKNDKIVNSGGIIGIIDSIKDKEEEVVLKGGVHILKSSIVRVFEQQQEAAKESKET